jgi:hypothetical protein
VALGPAIADGQVDEAIAAIERRGACPQILYNLIEQQIGCSRVARKRD